MKTYQIKVASSARHNLACGHATSTTCYAETVTFSQLALFKVQHSGFSVRRSIFDVQRSEPAPDCGLRTLDLRPWTLDSGLWTLDSPPAPIGTQRRPTAAIRG